MSSFNPFMFRDLADVAEVFGKRTSPGGMLTVIGGTYITHAIDNDPVVHLAELTIGGFDDLVLFFPCRRLMIDNSADALAHLQRPEVPVDCMTCLVRERDR